MTDGENEAEDDPATIVTLDRHPVLR